MKQYQLIEMFKTHMAGIF